jgi:protein subunit release factor B
MVMLSRTSTWGVRAVLQTNHGLLAFGHATRFWSLVELPRARVALRSSWGRHGARRRWFGSEPSFNSEEAAEIKQWLATFTQSSIPRDSFSYIFSRSSGPGGQNVNKGDSLLDIMACVC